MDELEPESKVRRKEGKNVLCSARGASPPVRGVPTRGQHGAEAKCTVLGIEICSVLAGEPRANEDDIPSGPPTLQVPFSLYVEDNYSYFLVST